MLQEQPPAPRQAARSSNTGKILLWLGIVFTVVFIVPVVGCGALGAGFALIADGGSGATVNPTFGPTVAVIPVTGPIMSGSSTGFDGSVGSETMVDLINQARDDNNIKAVVLRINSPGGSVVASDEIYQALLRLDKPIVVSMGELAASGGYYIAAPADYIYATPNTLTGSIGVISQFINAEDLLDEIGVEVTVITAGEVKDFGSMFRDMTAEEQRYWQSLIGETHDDFIAIVAEGRGMSEDEVRQLADGRIYRGEQALDLGLVDELGYQRDAVLKAAQLGGISGEPNVIEMQPEYDLLDALYGFQAQQAPAQAIEQLLRQTSIPTLKVEWMGQ